MSQQVLRPVLFFNAQSAAGTSSVFNADYAYTPEAKRTISGTRADTGDLVVVLTETVVPQFSADGTPLTSIVVTATATIFTSTLGNYNSCTLDGPFTRVKLQKIGTGGAATFVGIV